MDRRCFAGSVSVALAGELDLASAPLADAELRDAAAFGDLLVMDLFELSFMDSAGLRVLLAADVRQRERGGRLVILGSPRQVRRLLELTGVSARLEMAWDAGDLAPEPARDARGGPLPVPGSVDAC